MTKILWQIPVESKVTISIYDATGRNIKTLINDNRTPGYYSIIWNRIDDNNKKVSAGIYFYEMRTDKYTARRKMVITN
jgi:flagellar hook assembly protein FlgD